jgi:hypothetical protein
VQTLVAPGRHVPAWQLSPELQRFPSSQTVPSAARGDAEQLPVAGLQVPARWHWSCAAQTTRFAPVQAPAWQVSVCVQASPSLHVVPFGWLPSAGHAVDEPLHVSAASH